MTEVRTRFAPSPTGMQHVGGFRTAMYNWLLARHMGGKFVLRIEDTDQARRVPGAIKYLMEYFDWLGMDIDEGPSRKELEIVGEPYQGGRDLGGPHGPYIQSQRIERYRAVAEELIAKGFCYRCDCSPERLEAMRNEQMARKELPGYDGLCRERSVSKNTKHVVRFRMPEKPSISVEDAVKGPVSWNEVPMRDPVLLKSDGFPTYHLAVVIDDHDMRISHVMRSDEWLSSVPLHYLLYQALGWQMPIHAHLPMVLGKDGKKLSKRHGNVAIETFKKAGYLPEALFNYVVLVGWSPGEGDEQEVFTRDELIQKFSLEHVNRASAVFDYEKLNWMNGLYIRNLSPEEFSRQALAEISSAGLSIDPKRWAVMAQHVQPRTKLMPEIPPMVEFLCREDITRDVNDMYQKGIDAARAKSILQAAHEKISAMKEFSHDAIDSAMRELAESMGLKPGPFFGVLRIAVTGKKVTPPLLECFLALGKEAVLKRLKETETLL